MSTSSVTTRFGRRFPRKGDSQYNRVAGFEVVLKLRDENRRRIRNRLLLAAVVTTTCIGLLIWW